MKLKARVFLLFLLGFSLLLALLCFFPRANFLDFRAQYLEGVKARGEKRLVFARRALRLNPIYPHTHLLLASVYLETSGRDPAAFPRAMEELRRAVALGAYRGSIPWEAFKVYLTLWPFLSPEDREAALRAGKFAVPRMNEGRVREALDLWAKFCRDFDFMFSVLKKRPKYMAELARVVYEKGMPLRWRWRALTEYETWLLKEASRRDPASMDPPQIKRSLFLMDAIKLYHRLSGEPFEEKFYRNFLEKLLYQGALKTQRKEYIVRFLHLSRNKDRIKKLMAYLEERGLLSGRDFSSLFLREFFLFKLRDFERMEKEIEEFRGGIRWIKKGETEDYVKVNLLLVDYFYQENLLLRASSILEELLKISRSPEVLVRMKRIKEMTGEDCSCEAPDFHHRNPVRLNLHHGRVRFYFSPPVGSRKLELEVEPPEVQGLLQVFLDGKIASETYIKGRAFLSLPLPAERDFFAVEVKAIHR